MEHGAFNDNTSSLEAGLCWSNEKWITLLTNLFEKLASPSDVG